MNARLSVNRFRIANCLLLIASLLLAIDFFCFLEVIDIGNFFNSDSLYLPSIYRDLFIDKNGFAGWHLNAAPNFFPDMLFYFCLMFLCCNNFILTSFLFALIQYFFIIYLSIRVFKAIAPGRSQRFYAIIYVAQALWLLDVFYLKGNFLFAYFLFSNSYHTGSFVMSLCCFLLVLDFLKSAPGLKYIGLFILVLLSTFSDKLFIVLFVAPCIFASIFLMRKHFKVSLLLILISVIASGLAVWLFNIIEAQGYIYFIKPALNINYENFLLSYQMFCRLVKEYVLNFGYRTICFFLFLASIAGLVFLFIKNRKSGNSVLKFFLLFIISQSFIVISAPIINGVFTGYDTVRYNIYPLYLTGVNICIFLAFTIPNSNTVKFIFDYSMLAGAACLLYCGCSWFNAGGLGNFFNYYPDTARRVDEIAEKEGLLNGVGNFWFAKQTTMFSKKGVKVYSVFDNLAFYDHVTNENWFFDQNNKFNFVLLMNFNDTTLYQKSVLHSKLLYNEPGFKLVKTNTFTFNQSNHFPKNN